MAALQGIFPTVNLIFIQYDSAQQQAQLHFGSPHPLRMSRLQNCLTCVRGPLPHLARPEGRWDGSNTTTYGRQRRNTVVESITGPRIKLKDIFSRANNQNRQPLSGELNPLPA